MLTEEIEDRCWHQHLARLLAQRGDHVCNLLRGECGHA
jgi:hypothetical protein